MAVTHSRSLARYATRAAFTQEATDATASALNDALAVDVATKTDIKLLDTKLTAMEGKLTLLI